MTGFVSQCQKEKPMGIHRMSSSDQEAFPEGAVLSFHDICYRVKVKTGFLLHQKTVEKEIISNINGIMKPGLNAIMIPKGRGKSLLLDILAGRKDLHGLSGSVLINGAPRPADFKYNSGYVFEGNAMMHTLTVRENLQFSAALRLPTTMTNDEKNERISKVLEESGLSDVADSKVGSKGERKRTSIAMELITDPSILFLDEPTTDLDLSTATAIFLFLERLAKKGRTIIFSIHQPRYSIFKLFDSLTLLASGKLLFHGPAQEALQYFASAGYPCGPYNNPANFILDVINGDISAVVLNREDEDHEANETEVLVHRQRPVIETLAEFYSNSSFYKATKTKLDQLSGCQKRNIAHEGITCVTSFCHQLRWIMWRSLKNILGFPQYWIPQIIFSAIWGLIIGGFFLGLKHECHEIQYRAWTLYLLITLQCVTSLSTRKIFVLEKKLFIHESISGYYSISSYFFGKLLSDLLLRSLFPSIVFTSIVYFIQGLKKEAQAFFITIFTVLLVFYTISSLILAIRTHEFRRTAEFLAIYILLMTVFFSMSVIFTTIPPVLSWLQYLSIPYYGYMALQRNEFLGQNFCPEHSTTESNGCLDYVICTGEEFLKNQGVDLSSWSMWKNYVALTCIMIIFLIITYLRLLLLKKHSTQAQLHTPLIQILKSLR